ncbi:hypothetical protein AAFF_G00434200 [Aldrovandia affinis]|uniref:Uncharacterized protein n=1 Tax=Aldrovandia affinis TaxID=143900 RepID=A0AAD7SAE9_9TELE|nr:hypothetical protein AAFF_G00434200 [Aldrovandia affinis]
MAQTQVPRCVANGVTTRSQMRVGQREDEWWARPRAGALSLGRVRIRAPSSLRAAVPGPDEPQIRRTAWRTACVPVLAPRPPAEYTIARRPRAARSSAGRVGWAAELARLFSSQAICRRGRPPPPATALCPAPVSGPSAPPLPPTSPSDRASGAETPSDRRRSSKRLPGDG